MMCQNFLFQLLVVSAMALSTTLAFSPSSMRQRTTATTTRQARCAASPLLFLTPQQASDLVNQASKSVYKPYEEEEDDELLHSPALSTKMIPTTEKQRSFVRRVFSLPVSLWHPHPKAEGVKVHNQRMLMRHHDDNDDDDNAVYFPVVGFIYVEDGPGHSRPLSTLSNPSCRLHEETTQEPLYGWFRPKKTCTTKAAQDIKKKKNNNDDKNPTVYSISH